MNGNQNLPFHYNGLVPSNEMPNVNTAGQDFAALEERLRGLVATNNGNLNRNSNISVIGGENRLTGGPPPAKPFPGPFQLITADNQQLTKRTSIGPNEEGLGNTVAGANADKFHVGLAEDCAKEEAFISRNRLTEFKPCQQTLKYLSKNDVRALKKKSQKFPQALYYCRICDYHCDTLAICVTHIEDVRHNRLIKMQELDTTLFHLPKPSKHHLDSLNQLIYRIEREHGLPIREIQRRNAMASRLTGIMQPSIPGCTVRLYGSSSTGFGLIDSGLNLDLLLPENGTMPLHVSLINAYNVLSSAGPDFRNVQKDFSAKIPTISFTAGSNNCTGYTNDSLNNSTNLLPMQCELSLNNHNAFQTSQLLADYCLIDPRVRTLGVCIRHWARTCKIDRQSEGTLPSHAFPIMLIHFLQQEKKPVLPCIHDYLPVDSEIDSYKTPLEEIKGWKTRNAMTVGELLIEFFEYYSLGFNMNENVVSIRKVGGYTRIEKQWKGKKLVVEDPFSTKRSLTRSVNSLTILDFINDCFKIAYLYFGSIQTVHGPVITKIVIPDSNTSVSDKNAGPKEAEENGASTGNAKEDFNTLLMNMGAEISPAASKSENQNLLEQLPNQHKILSPEMPARAITAEEFERALLMEDGYITLEGSIPLLASQVEQNQQEMDGDGVTMGKDETLEVFIKKYGTELSPRQAQRVTELVPKNMIVFRFDSTLLTGGQAPAIICTVCGLEGHLQNICPDEQIPPLKPLPIPLPREQQVLLDRVCEEVMHDWQPQQSELVQRERIVEGLTRFIIRSHPNAILTVFGSSVNGFAFVKSDLDISLTLRDHETDANLDSIGIIENLAEKLVKMLGIREVQAITSAKVPIIKFLHHETQVEGDISLYNILAQENTRMIRFYSFIDNRVKILGYMVKLFAKLCEIGDASRGSLSSYAYILMMIHYLQRCVPPVIPVLQELYPRSSKQNEAEIEANKPVKMVDGWNAWFFDDCQNLVKVWPGFGQNRQSVGTLWLGFLDYYAQWFDDKNEVVCIRKLKTLTKFEKMWNSPCIAIEDPFDLSHNLGAGISRKMNLFIKKAFVKTRGHFGFMPMDVNGFIRLPRHYKQFLFDPDAMTDGSPPNDRGCRACGKIGHLVRDCPRKKNSDERRKREQREHQQSRERQRTENRGGKVEVKMNHNLHQQTNIQSPTSAKLSAPTRTNESKDNTHFRTLMQGNIAAIAKPNNHVVEQQEHSPLDNQQGPNPLLSMLANLGMNLGVANVAPTGTTHKFGTLPQQPSLQSQGVEFNIQQLLPQGVNAISAEELERRLISSEDNNSYTKIQQTPNYSLHNRHNTEDSAAAFNIGSLLNPPPGFSQPKPVIPVSAIPPNLLTPPALFPPFGLVGPPTIIPPSTLHTQNPFERSFTSPTNNLAPRFPLSEGLQNNSLAVGSNVAENLIHSSPFGIGLPIGGLQHMIGVPRSGNPAHSTSVQGSSPGASDSGLSLWNSFPSLPQTQVEGIGAQRTIRAQLSPTISTISSEFSFHLPLNDLLKITPSTAADRPTAPTANMQSNAQLSTPWPPK